MPDPISRREALRQLGVAGAGLVLAPQVVRGETADFVVAGSPVEMAIASLSAVTVRVTVRPIEAGRPVTIAVTGALDHDSAGTPRTRGTSAGALSRVRAGDVIVRVTDDPPVIHIETARGEPVQRITLSRDTPRVSFLMPKGPLLGLGEGGPQFDRTGNIDTMRNGQGAFKLATHGTRAPIQWLIGTTDGWAMFIHQPYGAFDFTGAEAVFTPAAAPVPGAVFSSAPPAAPAEQTAVAIDLFIVASRDPAVVMREYARITGLPELPARWTFGYQQSHRTLAGPDEILGVARTMREKRLPCDALIYLGTEFTPSGWNTRNGEFTWHPTNFPEPKKMVDALHADHFRVVVHIVIEGRRLTGAVSDPCSAAPLPSGRTSDDTWPPDRQVSCYWPAHDALMATGIDGWWPDQGDGLDGPSRLNRHRMYWEGTQLNRPNERPYALHRNASAGVQRFGGFIWSGDVQSRWETLKTHVPVALNTSLSGLPYWGTDIGGFIPTADYTGELHVRWFQFGAFNPLFRSHGRNWHLRLPWGWNGGDGGPFETGTWRADPAELHNADVEPICRKYLELRYRLLPYLYTVVRDCHETGMPIMRALWLHHADDPAAIARGDEYLWGRDILVAPVVERGATNRRVYLPRGTWIDFWTEERTEGGREIDRAVDLATMPLYVRAGAVIPMDPVRQYVDEPNETPLTLVVYPGANGISTLYEDDGHTFEHRTGAWMRITMRWDDAARRLSLGLAAGSRLFGPPQRPIHIRVAGSTTVHPIVFTGRPMSAQL